jgi:FtsH-binding integral membrane protein
MTNKPLTPPRHAPGRTLLLLGLALAALGIAGYAIQLAAHRLTAPWYMPLLATLGVVFVIASLWQKRSAWRILFLLLVMVLAGAEWAFLLVTRLPAYAGPVVVGQPLPAFASVRADGTPFTHHDLIGDRNNVLVFFRGRW